METAVQGILHDLKVFDIRVLIIILQLERKLQKPNEVRQGYKQFWILLGSTVSSLGDFDSLPFVNFLPIHCILMYTRPGERPVYCCRYGRTVVPRIVRAV